MACCRIASVNTNVLGFGISLRCLTDHISQADGTSTSRPSQLGGDLVKSASKKITDTGILQRTEYKFSIISKICQLVHVLPQEFEH